MSIDANTVADSLRVIARFTHSKGARLVFLNQDWRSQKTVYSWPVPLNDLTQDCRDRPDFWMQSSWWIDQLRMNRFLCIQDLTILPQEAREDLCWLGDGVLKGLCLLAIYDGKRLAAILQLDNPSQERLLRACDIHLISTASATILHMMFDPNRENSAYENFDEMDSKHPGKLTQTGRQFFLDLLGEVIQRKGRLFAVLVIELEEPTLQLEKSSPDVRKWVMKTAIERVRSCLRVSDIVLELDDGQVGVILVDLFDAQVSQQILGRISEAFNSAMRFRDEMFQLKLKVGMAFPEQGENQAEALLAAAQGSLNRQEVSKELAGEMI